MDIASDDRDRRELRRLLAAARVVPSVADRTWMGLLLAYLDAEERAVWVIGDYLEGEGLPRIKPGGLDKRIRHTLGLIPPLLAHELACDFAEHLFEWDERPAHPGLLDALSIKRRWLKGELTDEQLKSSRHYAQGLTMFGATAVAQALSSSPSPSVAQRASALALDAINKIGGRWRQRFPTGATQEARWQAERLRERLQR